MIRATILVCLASLAPLSAQIIDTIGSTATSPTGANRAKANLFAVDTSVLLLEFEVYLDVSSPETLTFFAYRHHSRTGTATLAWTIPVSVPGGGGPAWYSTGQIAMPLVAGNHYALGVSWAGSVTYSYSSIPISGQAVSFGSWQRAHTLTNPVPPTLSFGGVDAARYYQRITTLPIANVVNVGTGCSTLTLAPRFVAAGFFPINTSQTLELVDASPSSIGVFALAVGPALSAPLPVFGCDVWLDLSAFATAPTLTDTAGYSSLTLPIPNNPLLAGQSYTAQALVFNTAIDLSNAVQFTIN